jgi:hypothetical protein
VTGTAIGGDGGVQSPNGREGASVTLSNAVGGATTGTLNLTQTAIGGNGNNGDTVGGFGGSASSTLTGTNPSGASSYNLSAFATGGDGAEMGQQAT